MTSFQNSTGSIDTVDSFDFRSENDVEGNFHNCDVTNITFGSAVVRQDQLSGINVTSVSDVRCCETIPSCH
jgi:hypothetical protein